MDYKAEYFKLIKETSKLIDAQTNDSIKISEYEKIRKSFINYFTSIEEVFKNEIKKDTKEVETYENKNGTSIYV